MIYSRRPFYIQQEALSYTIGCLTMFNRTPYYMQQEALLYVTGGLIINSRRPYYKQQYIIRLPVIKRLAVCLSSLPVWVLGRETRTQIEKDTYSNGISVFFGLENGNVLYYNGFSVFSGFGALEDLQGRGASESLSGAPKPEKTEKPL